MTALLDLAVVIPTFNEAGSISQVVGELPRDLVREVIVADGGSTDGTQDRARARQGRQRVLPFAALFQVDHDDSINMGWGDLGILLYFIEAEALAAPRLDRVGCEYEGC